MSRQELIARIEALSEREYRRLAPVLEANLDLMEISAAERRDLVAAARAGLKSARTEPLIPHAEVMRQMRSMIRKRR